MQTVAQTTGWSRRRLIPALGLSRASVSRWSRRIHQGLPAVRAPGRVRAALVQPERLTAAITALQHGLHRTRGAPALWQQWRGAIARKDFADRVRAQRQALERARRERLGQVIWTEPCAVWAMDPAQYGTVAWNLVGDLASRLRFELLVAVALPACFIVRQLQRLFERHGAPLVLKRDNGSNLCTPAVDDVLNAFGVIALTSPVHYPRYNGAIEYAQREMKATVGTLTGGGLSLDAALEMAPVLLNAHPRRCLGGDTAEHVFHKSQPQFQQTYTRSRRKEVKEWIEARTETIIATSSGRKRRAHDAARRQAVVAWMREEHLIELVPPKKVLPQSQ